MRSRPCRHRSNSIRRHLMPPPSTSRAMRVFTATSGAHRWLGAFRATFPENEWQKHVLQWMDTSSIVVLIAGETDSVVWELRQAYAKGAWRKVRLLLPAVNDDDVMRRWQRVTETLIGTPWHATMLQSQPRSVLAALFLDGGEIALIRSYARRERDYDIALRIGLFVILASDPSAGR